VTKRLIIIAPLLYDIVDEEPVYAIKEVLGEDELLAIVEIAVAIVVKGMWRDRVLRCDVDGVPLVIAEAGSEEGGWRLLDPLLAPEELEILGSTWEAVETSGGGVLIVETVGEETIMDEYVVAGPSPIDIVEPVTVYAEVTAGKIRDELLALCPGALFMLVGTLVNVAVEAFVDSIVAW
jgi:hypothetical protein